MYFVKEHHYCVGITFHSNMPSRLSVPSLPFEEYQRCMMQPRGSYTQMPLCFHKACGAQRMIDTTLAQQWVHILLCGDQTETCLLFCLALVLVHLFKQCVQTVTENKQTHHSLSSCPSSFLWTSDSNLCFSNHKDIWCALNVIYQVYPCVCVLWRRGSLKRRALQE